MAASRLADGRYGDGYVASDHALAAILRYRSPFDDFVQGLSVPRKPRTRIRKCPGDAWLEAARRAAEDEATQEHEVAEALFDLANMFAAAEPVLEAEEAATNSPPAGRAAAGGGHRAKRARNAKTRAAAEPVFPSRTSARNHAAHHSAHNTASGFQDALARQADAAVHDYGLAAQLAANAHAADAAWDRRSPANGLTQNLVQSLNASGKLGNPASLPNNGGFAPNGLPSGLAGFYPPNGVLPPGLGAPGSAWGALPAPSDDRSIPKAQLPAPLPPAFSVPQHGEHRFPRCASHVYIAHFIEYQSKLEHQRQAAGLPSAGHYEGFYQPGAQAPPGFPGGNMPQQNGSASHNYKPAVKQEPQQQQQQPQMGANGRGGGPQLPQMSGSLSPFGGPGPVTSGAPGSGRGPPGAAGAVPSAAALQQQQQAYAAQLSQLAMLSQQSGAAFSLPSMPPAPPFLQPPGGPSPGGMPTLGGMGGLNAQQAAAAAAAAPFFSQQGFNLASLLPPGAMAQLASTSSGMQMDLKDGLLKQSPSAPRLDDLSALLPPNASREDVQAWAMKNLYANGNGGGATSQPQQQAPHQQQPQHQQQQQQQHGHQQGQGRQQNGQQQHGQQQQQQQQQQQGGNGGGGGGGSKNSYQLAEAQLKQFHEAFANAERERKLRTAGMMDGHGMPPNIIDPAGGGNSTRITLAHH